MCKMSGSTARNACAKSLHFAQIALLLADTHRGFGPPLATFIPACGFCRRRWWNAEQSGSIGDICGHRADVDYEFQRQRRPTSQTPQFRLADAGANADEAAGAGVSRNN